MGLIINPYFFAAGTPFTNTYSVDFDGVNDYVGTGATISTLGITDKFTFSFWIKLDSIANYDGVLSATSGSSWSDGFGCYISTTGNKLKCFVNNYSSGGLVESGTLSTGTWYHFLWCYDGDLGSNNIELFIDGSSVDTAAFTATVTSSTNIFDIGRVSPTSSGGGSYYAFNGNLDEVALWNTDQRADVATIYNSGEPADLSSLSPVAWWRMGDGDTYPMLNNNEAYSNRSVDFDGVDDYVKTSAGPTLSGDATISFWMNLETQGAQYKGIMSSATAYTVGINNTISLQIYNGNTASPELRVVMCNGTTCDIDLYDFAPSFSTGTWYHIALVLDATANTVTVYSDGSSVGTPLSTTKTWADIATGLFIGAAGGGGSATPAFATELEGKIDEISIFNSALTSGNITTIYNSGTPTDLSSLSPVAWYRMGDGDVYPTLTDHGSGSNNGTMTNMVAGDITGAETTGIMTNMVSGDIVADVP